MLYYNQLKKYNKLNDNKTSEGIIVMLSYVF